MNSSDLFKEFIGSLFTFLTKEQNINNDIHIFRTHNNKLDSTGDLSLPLNEVAWKKYMENSEFPIFKYIKRKSNSNEIFQDLLENSKNWSVSVDNCIIEHEKLNLFISRVITFKVVITKILHETKRYGRNNLLSKANIKICLEDDSHELSIMNLTQLRMLLLKDVITNVLQLSGNDCANNCENIILTSKSKKLSESKNILCGVVISNKFSKKNMNIKAQEYYEKRTVDMRLMAQHKYGVRVNSESGWKEFFERLGSAAVTLDLLYVKPNRSVVINIDNSACNHSKGASFILYNCARLSTILKQFDLKVAARTYPTLPDISSIDFALLSQPEEWEILYVYLMQYPYNIEQCIKDIGECKINIHNLCMFLNSLCSVFSVYYRRVRILTEPRDHLFPVLHARIYLIKAIQEVLHNALALLNIPPVKQM